MKEKRELIEMNKEGKAKMTDILQVEGVIDSGPF